MQFRQKTSAVVLAAAFSGCNANDTASPVAKVLELLSGLQAKILGEGTVAQKEYDEYAEWCEDRSKNVDFEIKTGKSNVEELKATIEQETSLAVELTTKIEELAGNIATDEADLKAATEIRTKEAADFAAEDAELVDVIDTLGRAIGILEREMKKGGASMMQLKSASNIAQALSVMVSASMFSSADAKTLTALVQSNAQSDDDAEETGAPAAAVYEGHSGGILDTLGGLLEKAQTQLDDARNKETAAKHNFEMLKQSLEDEIKFANQEDAAAKKNLAASAEKKSVAEGDLSVTSADLSEDIKTLGGLHQNCMTRAQDFEAATKSRSEELGALAAAKKVIGETTGGSGGAADVAYGFIQIKISSSAELANFEAVRFVRDLARKHHSSALTQLASRMASAMRVASTEGTEDPFAKVTGLIRDMIEKLEGDAQTDASHKAYCDKELAYTTNRKSEKTTEIQKLSTSIDQMSARSAQLKEEVAALQKELAEMAQAQASWDKFRHEENSAFKTNKAEVEEGLGGVKTALKVLRDYYAKGDATAATGAATGIIGLLEVVESDFSKGLAEMTSVEENAQATYDAATKENAITKATKDQDVKYKTKESVSLDKAVAEANSDRSGVQSELAAINEYLGKLESICIAKAEPYEETVRRRQEEIAGLKQALEILSGEAVLLQSKHSLRGVKRH
jgi:chromosome segregation ATPase